MKLFKNLIFVLVIATITNYVSSQSYQDKFSKYFNDNDTLSQRVILEKWTEEKPEDPELFASYLNYHFFKAQNNFLVITPDSNADAGFILKDSLEQTAGFMNSESKIDLEELQKGIDKIDKGIELYPDRLDMRFGKMYVYGMIENWDKLENEIIKTVDYSSINNNQWKWKNDEKMEDGEKILLQNIQDYQIQFFNSGVDSLLGKMQNIAEEILKYYPENIENITNLAISYLIRKDTDKGLELLLKAEKLNPSDMIVVSNIANCYYNKGDYENSKLYYQKMVDSGDTEAAEFGRNELEKLKNIQSE